MTMLQTHVKDKREREKKSYIKEVNVHFQSKQSRPLWRNILYKMNGRDRLRLVPSM